MVRPNRLTTPSSRETLAGGRPETVAGVLDGVVEEHPHRRPGAQARERVQRPERIVEVPAPEEDLALPWDREQLPAHQFAEEGLDPLVPREEAVAAQVEPEGAADDGPGEPPQRGLALQDENPPPGPRQDEPRREPREAAAQDGSGVHYRSFSELHRIITRRSRCRAKSRARQGPREEPA